MCTHTLSLLLPFLRPTFAFPGVSRSIVPLLAAKGVKSLHLGYNAQCITPALPSVLRWQHPETSTEIMLMISDTYGEEESIRFGG